MTYQCNKCFKRFDEPDYRILKDDHEFSDELGSHELAKEVCPFCGSGDIGEVTP